MEEVLYKVFAKLDEHNCITDIWSTGNQCLGDKRKVEEMIENGYVNIDEGSNGKIFGHAQVNYLIMKFGKPKYDEKNRCNYKLVNLKPTFLSDEEKEKLYLPIQQQPTFEELQNDINIDFDFRISELELGI